MQAKNSKDWLLLTAFGFLVIVALTFLGDGIEVSSNLIAKIYHAGESMGNSLNNYQHRSDSCR